MKVGNIRSVNWAGRRLGFLTGVEGIKRKGRAGNAHSKLWLFRCDCGETLRMTNNQAHKLDVLLSRTPNARHLLARLTCRRAECSVREHVLSEESAKQSAIKRLLPGDITRAKTLKESWTLTPDEWWGKITGPCQSCGHKPLAGNSRYLTGLNRLTVWLPGLGFSFSNTMPICRKCAAVIAGAKMSLAEFVRHATRVTNHNYGAWDFCRIDADRLVDASVDDALHK
jgi:hypothetical protein